MTSSAPGARHPAVRRALPQRPGSRRHGEGAQSPGRPAARARPGRGRTPQGPGPATSTRQARLTATRRPVLRGAQLHATVGWAAQGLVAHQPGRVGFTGAAPGREPQPAESRQAGVEASPAPARARSGRRDRPPGPPRHAADGPARRPRSPAHLPRRQAHRAGSARQRQGREFRHTGRRAVDVPHHQRPAAARSRGGPPPRREVGRRTSEHTRSKQPRQGAGQRVNAVPRVAGPQHGLPVQQQHRAPRVPARAPPPGLPVPRSRYGRGRRTAARGPA